MLVKQDTTKAESMPVKQDTTEAVSPSQQSLSDPAQQDLSPSNDCFDYILWLLDYMISNEILTKYTKKEQQETTKKCCSLPKNPCSSPSEPKADSVASVHAGDVIFVLV